MYDSLILFPWEMVQSKAPTISDQVEGTHWRQWDWITIYSKLAYVKEASFHPNSANVPVDLPKTGMCSVSQSIQKAWVKSVLHSLGKALCLWWNTLKGMFKTVWVSIAFRFISWKTFQKGNYFKWNYLKDDLCSGHRKIERVQKNKPASTGGERSLSDNTTSPLS